MINEFSKILELFNILIKFEILLEKNNIYYHHVHLHCNYPPLTNRKNRII